MAAWFDLLRWNLRDARVFGAGFVLRHLSAARGTKLHSWHLKDVGRVTVRLDTSDIDVVRQIFQSREYDLSKYAQYRALRVRYDALLTIGKVPIIIDAGANIGASALWFEREFPRAKVLAVEPDADNAEICSANIANHDAITLHRAAIGSVPGRIVIENPGSSAWGRRTVRSEDVNGIEVVTIPQFVASVEGGSLFVVKIDIEGFEQDLFAGNLDWIDQAAVIIIEPHDWMRPGKGTSFALQKAMGDRRFELLVSGENLLYFNSADPAIP